MRGIVAPVMILLLAVLHAPDQAQALLFDFLPAEWIQLSSEPITLILTGIALLSLGRMSVAGSRGAARPETPVQLTRRVRPEVTADRVPAATKRAA